MSFLQKRGKNWYLFFRDASGQQKAKSLKTGNQRTAEELQRKFDQGSNLEKFGFHQSVALSELLNERVRFHESLGRSQNTIKNEVYIFNAFLRYLGRDSFQQSTKAVLEDYKDWLRSKKVNPVTINTILKTLRAVFNWGAAKGYCQAAEIELVKVEKRMPMALGENEVAAFFEAINQLPPAIPKGAEISDVDYWREYWKLVFELYLYTGGRKEEIASLTWGDIDLDREVVVFRNTKASQEREVPLHPAIAAKLREKAGSPGDRLCAHSAGVIYHQCRRFMEKAGITHPKKWGLHALRRTFGSHLIMKTGDIATTSRLLGHSSPRVTYDSYVDILQQHARDSIKKLSW